ncbi:MAG: site-specific integrase [Erysipelotrichaceae bacterium]|nr:site-specific integrase [Erysipelotrichaceae bacterium]
MTVKADVRYVNSKRDKTKKVKKTTYKCEGSYVDIDSVPHRYHKRGFATAEEAKEWERTFLLKATKEVTNNITFRDLYILFRDSRKLKMKEQSFYKLESLANIHLLPYWGDVQLSKITIDKIEDWQNDLLNKRYYSYHDKKEMTYHNSHLERIQSRFKSIVKYGISKGYIKDIRLSMFDIVLRKNELKKEMLFWQPEEFMCFIKEIDQLRFNAFFSVLYWCGLRMGEALALTWNDIDFITKTIKIRKTYSKHGRIISTPKTSNSVRDVIVPNNCFNKLVMLHDYHSKIIGYNDDRFVFNFDKPLDDNSIRYVKNRACQKAGIKQIRIHDFRHSHVSLLINQGFSPFDIAKRLGHTVEMVNNVYGHWFTDAQQSMVNCLDEIYKNLV